MKKALALTLAFLLLGFGSAYCASADSIVIGTEMADFSVPLLDGSVFTLSGNRGKAVFVNVWASWCGPCAAEIPDLQKISLEYPDTLIVLGLNCGEDEQTVRSAVREYGATYPQALDESTELINARFPTDSIPYTIVIGADGTIVMAESGSQSYATFLGWYKSAIASATGQSKQTLEPTNAPVGDAGTAGETAVAVNGMRYETHAGEAVVTGYTGGETALVIPDTLGGYPVTAIGKNAFQYNANLESVVLPDSVRSIGDLAFDQCFSLRSINFPSGLTSIGACAFGNCYELKRVIIPGGVSVIPEHCFWGCVGLQIVLMEEGVREIGVRAFAGLEHLRTIYFPKSLQSIHETSFENCTGLSALFAYPGSYAAGWAKSGGKKDALLTVVPEDDLQYESLEDSVTVLNYFGSESTVALPWTIDGKPVQRLGDGGFNYETSVQNLYVPEGVETIGNICGRDSTIQEIHIPASVTSIGEFAFDQNQAMRAINVDVLNNDYSSADGVLFTVDGKRLEAYPCGKPDASYNVPEGTTEITVCAMISTQKLEHLVIPASVTSIGRQSLAYGSALASITVDPGNPVFFSDDGVLFSREPAALVQYPHMRDGEAYKIPNGVGEVLICAFYECRLQSVEFPDSVTYIGDMAFMSSESLRDVRLNIGLQTIDSQAFDYCNSLQSIRVPSSVEAISNSTFNADYLKEAIVEEGSYAQRWFTENGFAAIIKVAPPEEARNIREAYAIIAASRGLEKRMEDGESFDFYTGEIGSYSGGDFYYGSLSFWGNNGQRGIAKIGKADSADVLAMPSEYTIFGVPAVKGWYYVSLSAKGEGYYTLLKVTGVGEKWVSVVYCNFHD